MANELAGKIALVTGASRGIGKGVAEALGAAGATVYVTGRTSENGVPTVPLPGTIEATAANVTAAGGKGTAILCDHADDSQSRAAVAQVLDEQGQIDILVNNAWGGYQAKQRAGKKGSAKQGTSSGFKTPFWRMPPDFIDSMFTVGVRSTYVMSALVAESMVARHSGLIVHLTANLVIGASDNVAYGASKAAVNAMAADMGKLLAPEGVVVVALAPDHVATEMIMAGRKNQGMEQWMESPQFVGKAIVAFAIDPTARRFAGQVLRTRVLAQRYGFADGDGHQPTLKE